MKTMGKVFKYGDDVNTEVIIPARYLNVTDEQELAVHCMEDLDETFVQKVSPGDVVVAGRNFGCGSSREHAPLVLRVCRIGCVIARSYARIFYRNAINIGLPILECNEACDEIQAGDTIEVDFDTGLITDHTLHKSWQAQPFPPFIQDIIKSGGLLASLGKHPENKVY